MSEPTSPWTSAGLDSPACRAREELARPFRLIMFDWDGTAVEGRSADATRVTSLIDRILATGTRVAIVTGTKLQNVLAQLGEGLAIPHRRLLFVAANRGSEVFAFDRRGDPIPVFVRTATPEENAKLDAAATEIVARLTKLTGLSFGLVRDRLNRRKIDLIPTPEWADPPKSAIGALLNATEARLRGAGLGRGVREAFEVSLRVAHELGLPDARVTSDVKHVEVGLTDKRDAVAYLLTEVAAPLAIPSHDILVLGDEFGPLGGFEGSDSKMLDLPGIEGATVVSVGPEPAGAPPSVLHLGGGPARFCELLEDQLDLNRRLGCFATPRDAAWIVEEGGFEVAREHEIESILSLANGYLGTRGSLAEGSSVSRPATFLAGAFEASNDLARVPELVVLPDWGRIRVSVEGEEISVERGTMTGHRRVLDMRRGVLFREGVAHARSGHITAIRTIHAASLANRHLLFEGIELTPSNYSGWVRVETLLSGEVRSASGALHWQSFTPVGSEEGPTLLAHTYSGLSIAIASRSRAGVSEEPPCFRETTAKSSSEACMIEVRASLPSQVFREVAIVSSRETNEPEALARKLRREAGARPFDAQLGDHSAAWQARWRDAAVEIDGAPRLERALRFALYHVLAVANPADPRTSIGARGLAGEAYRGHVFWDADVFVRPFYDHALPAASRAMLEYRYLTLDGARRKAKRLGYEGALYAWESADSGDEATPNYLVTPMGEVLRVRSGELEQHISADVAHAVDAYVRATGDDAFLREGGLEILVETARFWASRAALDEHGVAHIRGVIGPDEYHEDVDDNAFTNALARSNMATAVATATRLGDLGLFAPGEAARFTDLARRLHVGIDPETSVIEQFLGFSALEPIDLAQYEPRNVPIDMILGRARTQGSQIVKQADVVQWIAMRWDEIDEKVRRASFLYYEPRTAHGSSLSPGVHALVAARLGLMDLAARYLDETARIDLDDTMANASGGVHVAALGSLWQAIVFGCGGVRPAPFDDDTLILEPHLLKTMRHLGFPLLFRGRRLEIHLEPQGIEVQVEGDRPLSIRAIRRAQPIDVSAAPSRRYVLPMGDSAQGGWQETRP